MENFVSTKEAFALYSVDGVRQGTVAFRNLSMDSDRFVCLKDEQPGNPTSLVIVDTEMRTSERQNIKEADAAIMNPTSKILALRSGNALQVFDLNAKERITGCSLDDTPQFWRWLSSTTIAIVGTVAVYHWEVSKNASPPKKMFDITLEKGTKILNYKVDHTGSWFMINGCVVGQSGLEGQTQLYSLTHNASRILSGFAGTFASFPTPLDSTPGVILCLASSDKLLVKELPTAVKTDKTKMFQVEGPLRLAGGADFPVVVHVTKHNLVLVVSSQGTLFVIDPITGQAIREEKVSSSTVFCGIPSKDGGVLCVNNGGSVFSVTIDDRTVVSSIKNSGNTDLALRVAGAANLGGVEDLVRSSYVEALRRNDIEAVISVCQKAPGGILRTAAVLRQIKDMTPAPGQPQPLSAYFKAMMSIGPLNAAESEELARVVIEKSNSTEYIKAQMDEGKFTPSEGLGELVEPLDADLALRIYVKAQAHPKVLQILATKGDVERVVEYCSRVDFSPDWRNLLSRTIHNNPDQAVTFALAICRNMKNVALDPIEVTDMLVSQQHVRQATQFLMEILSTPGSDQRRLQTKLFEINMKHSPPAVVEKIFARNMYTEYDGGALAPLCEKAKLYQRAIECYMKAQATTGDANTLANIRRCLKASDGFDGEWLIKFFSKLSPDDSHLCLSDLVEKHEQHFNSIVQVAIKYSDALGASTLISMFLRKGLFDILFAYLAAVVPYTRDPEIHYRYIEAALEVGNMDEVERMTRESPCYDGERTKALLTSKNVSNLWPFINVCDKHDYIDEMVKFLVQTDNQALIEQYVQRKNPNKTPVIIGTLLDINVEDAFVQQILEAAGTMCPIEELVNQVEKRGRLPLIQAWLEARKNERRTDPALHTALAKVYVDINAGSAEDFLQNNEFYDSEAVGKFCESRNTTFALIAYRRAQRDDSVIELSVANGLWKDLARYLVKRQNPALWEKVLKMEGRERTHLVEAVQQVALPESKVVEEVITAVKAFLSANMNHELTSILDQIVLHGDFRRNRHLENLLIISAIKARPDKVMEYVNNLENYDAEDIANIAAGAGLNDVAFAVYNKHDMKRMAVSTLLHHANDLPRGRAYAEQVDHPEVWTVLGLYLLKEGEVSEAIDALMKAKNPDYVAEVTEACERFNQFGDLVKYLTMVRQEGKGKNPLVDQGLVMTYAKTGRLTELEEFLKTTKGLQVQTVADNCFENGLYDSARVLYQIGSNFSRLAQTQLRLKNYAGAVEAAEKAKNIAIWKEVNAACIEAGEMELAKTCAMNILSKAEELPGIIALYERAGYWEEIAATLKAASTQSICHMGIVTELGVLYARYKPERLIEHINLFQKKLNTHRLVTVCEEYHHWLAVRILYVNNEDWLSASQIMLAHNADSWDHEIFKEMVTHLGSSDVIYSAITLYVQHHPELLHNYLSHISSKLDPERVMHVVAKVAPVHIIRPYLEMIQERNVKMVNETLHKYYIEEENFAAMRKLIDQYNTFDSAELCQQLEKQELFEFRKIALVLLRRNKRYARAIEVAKDNNLFEDAIEAAAESEDSAVAQELLDFFVSKKYEEYFAACLYLCYDLIAPHVALEKAWRGGIIDRVMPFLIQSLSTYSTRLARIEKSIEEAKQAANRVEQKPAPAQRLIQG